MNPVHLTNCKMPVVPLPLVLPSPPTSSFAASPYFKAVRASG